MVPKIKSFILKDKRIGIQEDSVILNMYEFNSRISKYIKQKLTEPKGEI